MKNHDDWPTAAIISTNTRGDHEYASLNFTNNSQTTANQQPISKSIPKDSVVLCTFGIPFYMSIPEFLDFVAPVDSFVSYYKVIRNSEPDSYMVLMKFRDPYSANNYYKQYNKRSFSSMEPEECRIVYVESVQINLDSKTVPSYISFPFLTQPEGESLTCSVCLELMDENVTGLFTILCQHTFHCHCLSKWGDGSCPVCRYSQKTHGPTTAYDSNTELLNTTRVPLQQHFTGENTRDDTNECAVCKSTENLWICLICGHIGCGRYVGGHAHQHYEDTSHLYSLEIETQRVWDYAGDGYVHRLIQNAVDGKLVELPSTTDDQQTASQEKMEAMSIEYSYLLTSQLDSQRIYYENQMDIVSAQVLELSSQLKVLKAQSNQIEKEVDTIKSNNKTKERKITELIKEKEKAEEKLKSWVERSEATNKAWLKEREMADSVLHNNSMLLGTIKDKNMAVDELKDQARDLKFFLEAREKVQANSELEGGSVETHTPQRQSASSKKPKRKSKRPV